MENIGEQVRSLYKRLGRREQMFLGSPPYSSEVEREIKNHLTYKKDFSIRRQRTTMGACAFSPEREIIGYESMTIMENANPTRYERENLRLDFPLNYVQGKKIMVDPRYWGKGVTEELFSIRLAIAKEQEKDFVADVCKENPRVIRFLEKHGASLLFQWATPKGTQMYRFGISRT